MNTLPYKKLPRLMLIELVYQMVMWPNAFPVKSGIIGFLPQELVLRQKLDFKKHCRAQFGAYVEAHDEPVPLNGMKPCSTPSIVLGPNGNAQGTYKFMSLMTGKKSNLNFGQSTPCQTLCSKELAN